MLDGMWPASGQSARAEFVRNAGERGSFFGRHTPRRSDPLTLSRQHSGERVTAPSVCRPSTVRNRCTSIRPTPNTLPGLLSPIFGQPRLTRVSTPRSAFLVSCCARSWRTFRELEVPSIEEAPDEHPRGSPPRPPTSVGRRMGVSHVFVDVRRLRLDPSACRSSRQLQGRMRFCDFCRKCFNEHDQGPARASQPHGAREAGTIAGIDRTSPFDAGRSKCNHRGYAGSGVEDHRTSTFPFGIAPKRDFAPTPIASDSSCREGRSSAPYGATWDQERARQRCPACKARAARGPCYV